MAQSEVEKEVKIWPVELDARMLKSFQETSNIYRGGNWTTLEPLGTANTESHDFNSSRNIMITQKTIIDTSPIVSI